MPLSQIHWYFTFIFLQRAWSGSTTPKG